MALVTVNGKAGGAGLTSDARFRQWGKLVRGPQDVDLSKDNGYSLSGPFVQWGKTVALEPGQFLVLASETGSRNRHSYDYALVAVNADGEPFVVQPEAIDEAVAGCSDGQRAKAQNSRLFAFALFCSLAPAPATADRAPLVAAARAALAALTAEERAALVAELAA